MDRIISKASKRELPAGDEYFNLVGGRKLGDAVEDVGGAFDDEHLAISN
jgi:hypothetical protein